MKILILSDDFPPQSFGGAGYVFSSTVRTELVYYLNGSRNTYEDTFTETDQIFSLLLRHNF